MVKPSANELRQRFIERQIEKKEKEGDINAANQIRHMYKDEARRECQREFQQVMRPTGISKILHIEVRDDNNPNEIIQITNRDKMEKQMMRNFKEKYLEVYDTNTTMEPLLSILGKDGLTEAAKEILKGTFKFPPVVHPDIIEFFQHMKISDEVMNAPPVKTTTRLDDFCSFWKAGREKIASSMSTIHNGHYIAAATSTLIATITVNLFSIPW